MIVTASQILNCGSKAYCQSFNRLKKKVTCVRENYWNLRKHFIMSVTSKQYMRLGAYVVAIWDDTQSGLDLCNLGRKLYSFHQVQLFVREDFSNQMQSKVTCAIGWPWRPLMLLCKSLFVGLKWMQWIDWATISNIRKNMREWRMLTLDW